MKYKVGDQLISIHDPNERLHITGVYPRGSTTWVCDWIGSRQEGTHYGAYHYDISNDLGTSVIFSKKAIDENFVPLTSASKVLFLRR